MPPAGWGKKIGRAKARKIMGQDKNSLSEGKVEEGKKKRKKNDAKAIAHHIPRVDHCPATLEEKHYLKPPPLHFVARTTLYGME